MAMMTACTKAKVFILYALLCPPRTHCHKKCCFTTISFHLRLTNPPLSILSRRRLFEFASSLPLYQVSMQGEWVDESACWELLCSFQGNLTVAVFSIVEQTKFMPSSMRMSSGWEPQVVDEQSWPTLTGAVVAFIPFGVIEIAMWLAMSVTYLQPHLRTCKCRVSISCQNYFMTYDWLDSLLMTVMSEEREWIYQVC